MSFKERYSYILGIVFMFLFIVGIYGSQKATEKRIEDRVIAYQREVQALKSNYTSLEKKYDSLLIEMQEERPVLLAKVYENKENKVVLDQTSMP